MADKVQFELVSPEKLLLSEAVDKARKMAAEAA